MVLAFVDDSGSGGDSPYFVLSGYCAAQDTWGAFSRDWQEVLSLWPKLEYFKMSEAESLKGQFATFTPEHREARLRDFIEVILKHEPYEASVVVTEHDYREVLYPVLHKKHASPYYSCFFGMVTALSGFYRHSQSRERVDFVFDEQQGKEATARRLYGQFRGWFPNWQLGRITFKNDRDLLPLQAADLIAWQTRRFLCFRDEKRREALVHLHSKRQGFRHTISRKDLQQMADAIANNIPKLREEFGDERIDRHLEGIKKRNEREASNRRKAPRKTG